MYAAILINPYRKQLKKNVFFQWQLNLVAYRICKHIAAEIMLKHYLEAGKERKRLEIFVLDCGLARLHGHQFVSRCY